MIGTVTLPKSASSVHIATDAIIDALDQSGRNPILSSTGLNADDFTMTGIIGGETHTISSILSTYAVPLWAYRGGTVVVATPYAFLNGTYMVEHVDFSFSNEEPKEVGFTIKFKKGSGYFIV